MQASTVQANIETWLRDKLGWSPEIVGSHAIAKAVEQRRLRCGVSDLAAYLQRLQVSKEEQLELAESLIVPETWFFRDQKLFDFLTQSIQAESLSRHFNRPLRFLSIPCSSGEEPYSIAMMLLDLGMISTQFQIDAVDISQKSLLKAEQALYRRNSFRGGKLDFRDRYFHPIGDAYQLCDRIKHTVTFRQGNLLDPNFLHGQPTYDIIFCRNVLIYFDPGSRIRALQTMEQLLDPQGLLCLGGAESIQTGSSNFVSIREPISFVYRKRSIQASPLLASEPKALTILKGRNDATRSLQKHVKPPPIHPPLVKEQSLVKEPSPQQPLTSSKSLDIARQLADQGKLTEATEVCATYLQHHTIDVEAYVLLGQIYQGRGAEDKAAQYFQRAIYLEPNHYQALVHLALLKKQQGDTAKATVLQQRIERLGQHNRMD